MLESLRQHVADNPTIDVVLLDAIATADRDRTMADHLVGALENTPGIAIGLTGNLHNRRSRGTDFDPNDEPMGYLITQLLGDDNVRALDVRYTGGAAWVCAQAQTCGQRAFGGNTNSGPEPGTFIVELFDQQSVDGFDGAYNVGELTPSPPARDTTG